MFGECDGDMRGSVNFLLGLSDLRRSSVLGRVSYGGRGGAVLDLFVDDAVSTDTSSPIGRFRKFCCVKDNIGFVRLVV